MDEAATAKPVTRWTVLAVILRRRDFCFDDALEICIGAIEEVCNAATWAHDSLTTWTARGRSHGPGAHEKID